LKVHWTDTAINHLRSIHAYIGWSSPEYALRIVDRLTKRSRQIAAFPQSGRIVPEVELPQIREVLEGPYRVIYHIKPDQLDIIAVIHGS
jgi:toxin ParE1/3/4